MHQRTFRVLAWASLFAIFLFTDAPIWLRPVTHFSPNLERFAALCVVAAMFVIAYPKRVIPIAAFLICAVAAFELMQMLFAGRHATLHDAAVKNAGVLVGVWAGSFLDDVSRVFKPRES